MGAAKDNPGKTSKKLRDSGEQKLSLRHRAGCPVLDSPISEFCFQKDLLSPTRCSDPLIWPTESAMLEASQFGRELWQQ